MRKNNLLLWLLIVSNLLTCRMFSQNENEITDKETIPEINKNINKKTFIISSHHLSAVNVSGIKYFLKNYKTYSKKSLFFEITNCILKSNIEFELYNNFYLKTNFFNNVLSIYAMINETKNTNPNDSFYSMNEKGKLTTLEFFSFSIGKKGFYGKTTNMFSIEIGFNIGTEKREVDFNKREKKLGIIITIIPYRRAFGNGVHISTGHVIINLVSLYDVFFKNNEEYGITKYTFLLLILANALTLHIGYIT